MAKTKLSKTDQLLQDNPNLKRGDDDEFKFGRIPFNIEPLDILTGGGIPKKRFSLFTGQTNGGKSYLTYKLIQSIQSVGGDAMVVDTEQSWDADWVKKCGVDPNKVLVGQPYTGEEALGMVREGFKNAFDLVVLDSIAGLVPTAIHEEDFSYNPMAWQARFVNQSLPKLFPHLKEGSAFVAVNQVRSSMGPVSLDSMPGGIGQTFFSHFILQIRRSGWIKDGDKKVGYDMEILNKKTKVGGVPYGSCVVPFRVEGGIDILEMKMREYVSHGIIQKKGAGWYYFSENDKVQGMNGLREALINRPDLVEKLDAQLGDRIRDIITIENENAMEGGQDESR